MASASPAQPQENAQLPEGKIELTLYQKGVYIRWRAVTKVPMDTLWNVIKESLQTNWDPVARSERIVEMASKPLAIQSSGPRIHVTKTTPLVEDFNFLNYSRSGCADWETTRFCIAKYKIPERPSLEAQSVHTLKYNQETGKTTYTLEEHLQGDDACEEVKNSVGPENQDSWKGAVENAVKWMGDAMLQRAELVESTSQKAKYSSRRRNTKEAL
ncbi:hypothetical protein NM688_g5392 [Phlebia brevispora]|uniref:Uncharacterized protein n=1 Tax=Phlebia brevispora TaxID=194682 RepID=A0ACC1SWN2_9APHY|nr:hypothetical protein NM688_g5392 [Phlebia brevispora]